MASTTIGSAYIQIKPTTDGIQRSIQGQLKGLGDSTGEEFSKEMSSKLAKSTAIGVALGNILVAGARKAVGSVTKVIGDAIDQSNKLASASKVLQSMGYTEEQVNKSTEQLRSSLSKLPTSTASALKGVQQLAASWGDLDFSTDAFEAFNAAILYGGGTTENLENAITQLSQVALDGPLDAQTWLSLRNSGLLPAAQAVAELNGMSINDLKEALGKGEITTRDFMNALIKIDKETGKFSKGAEAANQTISGSFNVLYKNSTEKLSKIMDKLGVQSGLTGAIQKVGDAINGCLDEFDKFIDWLDGGSKDAQKFKDAIVGLSVTLGATGLTAVLVAVVTHLGAIGAFLASIGTGIVALISPIGLLVAAIGGIGTLIWTFRDEISDFITNGMPSLLADWADSIGQWAYQVGENIKRIPGEIAKFFETVWNNIVSFFSGIPQWFGNIFQAAYDWIKSVFQGIGQWFGDRVNDIKNFFTSIPQWFKDTFDRAVKGIKEVFGKITDWFKDRFEDIKNIFNPDKFFEIGKQIIEGLGNGISSMVGWIGDRISEFSSGVEKGFKDFFGIHSPSRLMRDEVGVMIGRGMADGITKSTSEVNSAMNALGQEALNQMASINGGLSGTITTSFDAGEALAESGNARVVQNNVFNVNDNFDLARVSSDLGYAVAMA